MQAIIVTTLYLLSILVPLTFTTINSELFEFPKFILLLSGTLVISAAWITNLWQIKKLKFPSHLSPISLSVLFILATQTLSTIFSVHPYTSFWGYYSRFHGGLLTTICYTIIYFAALNWLDKKSTQKIIKITVATSFVVGLYAILERLGIDKNLWIQDVQNRPFSTLGQPNWLAAYLIPNIFLTLYLSQTKKFSSHLSSLIFLLLFAALLFTKSRSGFLGFALSYATYWILLARQLSFAKIKSTFFRIVILLVAILLIFGSPYTPSLYSYFTRMIPVNYPTPQGTTLETGGTESGDIRKIVWSGALKLIAKYPLLGTGPETFAYTYYWVRPLAHNLTSEWDFLYNKAHNEYLNTAATTGLIGLLAYLYFHYAVFAASLTTIKKSKKMNQAEDENLRHYYPVLGASIVGFATTNFFGFSVIPVYLLMILLSALCTSTPLSGAEKCLQTRSSLGGPILLVLPLILLYPARLFYADLLFARGKAYQDALQLSNAIPLLERSAHYRPSLDLFHNHLGEAYATVALNIANNQDEALRPESSKYLELALQEVATTKRLNSIHLNDLKSRAKTYLTLALIDPKYNLDAAYQIESARQLSPTDPKLAYNLGLVYTRTDQVDKAENELRAAIDLKPNYAEPYYALTLLYEQTKRPDQIPPLLEDAKSNLATYSAALKEKIDKYAP